MLPIGGLKEKLLAAHRGGIKRGDPGRKMPRIPDNVKQDLEIYPVRWIDEVLRLALQDPESFEVFY